MYWLKNYNMTVQSDRNSPLLQIKNTYSSRGTTGVDAEGEIGEAIVAEVWFARCVLQGQGAWHKVAQGLHFHSQGSHGSVRVAL